MADTAPEARVIPITSAASRRQEESTRNAADGAPRAAEGERADDTAVAPRQPAARTDAATKAAPAPKPAAKKAAPAKRAAATPSRW